jgi:LPXTG-motif cell wall-anchored protein
LFPSGLSEFSILVYVSTISGLIILSSGIFIYLFKNKRKETI